MSKGKRNKFIVKMKVNPTNVKHQQTRIIDEFERQFSADFDFDIFLFSTDLRDQLLTND